MLLRIALLLCVCFSAISAGAAGNGTLPLNAGGEYEISTPDELVLFSKKLGTPGMPADGTYVLTRDVDMSAVKNFDPVRGFTGRFDGRRHAIRNLTVRQPQKSSVGLFAVLGTERQGATVENLALINVYVIGSNMVGGIAGTSFGVIRRCFVSGEVVSVLHGCGGIAGRLQALDASRKDAPLIEDCICSASVVSLRDSDSQGGIAGRILAPGGEVRHCIATGEVSGLSKTGGLVGQMVAGAILRQCVAANRWITPSSRTGNAASVVGDAAPGAVVECVLAWDRYKEGLPHGASAITSTGLLTPGNYTPLAFDPKVWIWESDENAYYPSLIGFTGIGSYFDFTWTDIVKITPQVSATLDRITVTLQCDDPKALQFAIELTKRGLPSRPVWSAAPSRTFSGLAPATAYELCYRVKGPKGASRWYRLTANTGIPVTADPTPRNISAVVTSDPTASMTVAWTTLDTTLHAPVVTLWPAGGKGARKAFTGTSHAGPVSQSVDKNLYATYYNFHTATLTGLKPATRYAYTVSDATGSAVSPERYFTTASRKGAVRVAYVADPQLGSEQARPALARTFAHIAGIDPEPAFLYVAGDMAERGYNCAQMDWTHDCADTLLARTFIVPVHGNHDQTDILLSYYPLPAGPLPATYSFDYGDAHFSVLNTQLDSRRQVDSLAHWLEADMGRHARRWNIVMLHKAIYAATDHVDDVDIDLLREILCPVLERLGVDAVLMGHDHCFTRSFVLDGQNAAPAPATQGVSQTYTKPRCPLYIVNGTSGTSKWYKKIPYDASKFHRVAPDYAFVDKCSSDYERATEEQSFSMVSIEKGQLQIDTYFFRASRDKGDEKPLYLYDSVTIKK